MSNGSENKSQNLSLIGHNPLTFCIIGQKIDGVDQFGNLTLFWPTFVSDLMSFDALIMLDPLLILSLKSENPVISTQRFSSDCSVLT